MTQQLVVNIPIHGDAAALHRRVLASLPDHFRIADSGPCDAVLLTHSVTETPMDARAVVLDGDGLHSAPLLACSSALVVPAWRFAPLLVADPSFAAMRQAHLSLVDAVVSVERNANTLLDFALVEQLAILRLLTGRQVVLSSAIRFQSGYVAKAGIDGHAATVVLTGLVSPAGCARLMLNAIGPASRLEIELDADAMARPASIRLFKAAGMTQTSPIYQSSHRLTWLNVHAMLAGGAGALEYDIDGLGDHVKQVDLAMAAARSPGA